MEINQEFKQTEVGVVPKDWNVAKIQSFTDCVTGGTPSTAKAEYWGGSIRWMSSGELNKKIVLDVDGRITEAGLRNSSATMVPANCVLIGLAGQGKTRGTAAFNLVPLSTNQSVAAILPNDTYSSKYLYYHIETRYEELRELSSGGGGRGGLNKSLLMSLSVPLPSTKREQEAIAAALGDVDALLDSLDSLIAKKRDIKQAVMQQLMTGKTRLPGFRNAWSFDAVGNCLAEKPTYGINAAAVPYSDQLPVYIRITDISDDGRFAPKEKVSVRSEMAGNYYLAEGDIVVARTGASVGKSYWYKSSDGPLVYAGFLIRLRTDSKKLLPAFLGAYLMTDAYWNWVRLMSMRSGQPGINGNEYAQLPVPVPPVPEQGAIVAVIFDLDAELAALDERRAKTFQLKQAMMQELLAGRTRLVGASHA